MSRPLLNHRPYFVLAPFAAFPDPTTAPYWLYMVDANQSGIYHSDGVVWILVTGDQTQIAAADTVSVDLSGDGTAGTPLTADVNLSADAGNALVENPDGLYVAAVGGPITSSVGLLG